MYNFTIRLPKIYFGKDSISMLKKELSIIGEKTLIVTGKNSAKESGALDDLLNILNEHNVSYKIYDKIPQNPTVEAVDGVFDFVGDFSPESIIGIGGGSPMDASKGIAILLSEGGSIWDYVSDGVKKAKKIKSALPLILIPTLSASGSEADGGAVFTNSKTKEKIPVGSVHIIPKIAVVDPHYTLTAKKEHIGFGGVDIFVHIAEPFLSSKEDSSSIADEISAGILRSLIKWLPVALKDSHNLKAREEIAWASTLALSGIPSSGRKGNLILHYIEHPISGHYDVVHGKGLSALLISYIKELYKILPQRVEKFFSMVFLCDFNSGIKKLENFLKENSLSIKLKELGVKKEELSKIADDSIRIYGKGKPYLGGIEEIDKNFVLRVLENSY